jgi:hypothetical protein
MVNFARHMHEIVKKLWIKWWAAITSCLLLGGYRKQKSTSAVTYPKVREEKFERTEENCRCARTYLGN